ncbi:hypothetical protein A6V39_05045 [Candidatus Mycoplasma haematobovis]|uniref:Uncharacterized protein n=1 Tax=Candidatus Mycoplasma haematobovis TaxID=432608 RepID=A0A1A9QCH5_9MOLU|nr:hypothetical protein [Candidatus Mycoplasma haematobovis]OAL09794.1 hypothetical protein A6V39_05045 [Candidatus Mycoplasma haematobovis]
MAIPSSLITNISLGSVGLATVGGVVYGSYELLKDNPRPISQFLSVKKKVALSQTGDEEAWKTNWKKYLDKYNPPKTPPKVVEPPADPEPAPEPIKNVWDLKDWDTIKGKPTEVPAVFKEKCKSKENEKVAGIWKEEFKNFLDYCTKDDLNDV